MTRGNLIRGIGIWGISAIVFNGVVGAGIFAVPGVMAERAGAQGALIVLLVGLGFLSIVVSLARLAEMYERNGGPIAYVEDAFGPAAGFQIGWLQIVSTCAAHAANANLMVDYLLSVFPEFGGIPGGHRTIVFIALMLLSWVNLISARRSVALLIAISILKFVPLIWLILAALPSVIAFDGAKDAVHWAPAEASVLAAYAFIGFEGALTPAGESRDPRRDLPFALVAVFIALVLLFAALTYCYVAVSYEPGASTKAPLVQMAQALGGTAALGFVLMGAVFSIFGNIHSGILYNSRRVIALEAQGALPDWFGRISAANGVPQNAVVVIVALIAGLALSGGFAALAILSVATRLMVYLGCNFALPVLRARHGIARFSLRDAVILPAIPVSVWLLVQTQLAAWLAVAGAMAIGAGIRHLSIRSRAPALRVGE